MILDEVSAFERFIKELDEDSRVFSHLDHFRTLVKDIHRFMQDTIEQRLYLITATSKSFEVTSARLRRLKISIGLLHSSLYDIYVSMQSVPRQLYYLTDHLLKCYNVECQYIISISQRIAVVALSDLLRSHRWDIYYEEFWNLIKDRQFYFVLTVHKISPPERSLDWIMILHEIGHIIDMEKKVVETYIPYPSVLESLDYIRKYRDVPSPILERAKKKLHATEFAADLIVTEIYGCFFGWRFLTEYGHWIELFEDPGTHPLPNQRISIIIDESKSFLKLEPMSRLLSAQLQERGWTESLTASSAISELPQIIVTIRTHAADKLTQEKIREELLAKLKQEESLPVMEVDDILRSIQRDLFQGRPTVLSPPLLYYVYVYGLWDPTTREERSKTIDEMIEKLNLSRQKFEERIGELLSDCFRLHCVSLEW